MTDHKPLVFSFSQKLDKASLGQQSQLLFLSKFTTNFQYIPGTENVVADGLSRVDLNELSDAQKGDAELELLLKD